MSSAYSKRARSPSESHAPDCTSDSSTRRFTSWITDVRSHRSSSDLNAPSASRISTMVSTAWLPTFLMAASPNWIRPSASEKSARERLMSGASTSMPRARQSTMAVATRSAEPSMWIKSDVMYSSG